MFHFYRCSLFLLVFLFEITGAQGSESHPTPLVNHSTQADMELDQLAEEFLSSLNWSNPYVKDALLSKVRSQDELKRVVVKTAFLIKNRSNPLSFESELKEKFSHLMKITSELFPELKWNEYVLNHGPNPKVPDELANDPRFLEQIKRTKYGVSLLEKSLRQLLPWGDQYFYGQADNTAPLYLTKLQELAGLMQNTLGSTYTNQTFYFAVQDDHVAHVTLLAARRFSDHYEFAIIDSTGGKFSIQPGPITDSVFIQKYTDLLIQSFGFSSVKISYFPTKRQRDLISCPIFIYRDFFTAKHISIFDYIQAVEMRFPYMISSTEIRGPGEHFAFVQSVPEHPSLLVLSQTVQSPDLLTRNFTADFVDINHYEAQMAKNISLDANQKPINFAAQRESLDLISALLKFKLLGGALFR